MDVVYAKSSISVKFGGAQVGVPKGSVWPASDPLVAQYADNFSTDPRAGLLCYTEPPEEAPAVEVASAAPGEVRNTRRGRPPASA